MLVATTGRCGEAAFSRSVNGTEDSAAHVRIEWTTTPTSSLGLVHNIFHVSRHNCKSYIFNGRNA